MRADQTPSGHTESQNAMCSSMQQPVADPIPRVTVPRVIGLDLSIAATGYAEAETSDGQIHATTIRTSPKDYGPDARDTWRRLATIGVLITSMIGVGRPPTLIVIEGPSYGSKGAALHQLAGLWWLIYDALTRSGHPIAVITPGELKKYATGRGDADKTAMAVALQKRANLELGDDNRVDAWWLAAAGLEHLGRSVVSVPQAQRDALTKVAWPQESPL